MEINHASMWTLENLAQVPGVKEPKAVILEQTGVSIREQDPNPHILQSTGKNSLRNKEVSPNRL